ncbi:MAG TPA: YIP1 family protein [Longimicrobiales bacterium]|nr:YIP1 family protein [Longimicrobiales bacterium]
MAAPLSQPGRRTSLGADLIGLITHPKESFPHLLDRGKSAEAMAFAAISGVYVAFSAAQRLHVGDRFGFTATALGVLVLGCAMGLAAFIAAGALLELSAEALRGHPETDRMYAVFGYATWPFTPLLVILVPVLYAAYGTALFSAARPAAGPLGVVVDVLEIATIGLWLYLMVMGISTAAALSRGTAVKALALTALEAVVLAVLLVVILFVSFLI